MKSSVRILAIFVFIICLPLLAAAWNSEGHNTAGAIAYYWLKKNDPAALAKIFRSLHQHPWYSNKWNDQVAGLAGEQKDVALFMLASTFPDDARSTPYDHPNWHYTNYPFVPAGQHITPPASAKPNVETVTDSLLHVVKTMADNEEKAIDLCWIFHLVEDLHQPLHAVSLYSDNFPQGDRGGNLVFIRLNASEEPVKLHSYWDRLVKGNFNNAPSIAVRLLSEPKYSPASLKEIAQHKQLHDWIYTESYTLAKTTVYEDGKINGTKDSPTLVDAGYIAASRQLGEHRLVISGIRLANLLSGMY